MGTFIFDELTGTPTILATNRAKREDQTGAVKSESSRVAATPPTPTTPQVDRTLLFSKGYEHMTPPAVYQDADDWNVRVIPNKYPIVGDHEVIVHSPNKDKDIEDFSVDQTVKIIRAYLNRVNYYTSREKEVLIFNNRGGKAGASIVHPHSQIIALKGFPGIIEHEKEEALKYYNSKNSCFWCDEAKEEIEANERLVLSSPHFVVFVPKASRWSYETILIPKTHRPNIEYINEMEINDLALVMKSLLKAYDELFTRPDRNFWIHTMRFEPYHWHVGFIPQLKVMGGLELGAGIWVSDRATPEDAATSLGKIAREHYENEKISIV